MILRWQLCDLKEPTKPAFSRNGIAIVVQEHVERYKCPRLRTPVPQTLGEIPYTFCASTTHELDSGCLNN